MSPFAPSSQGFRRRKWLLVALATSTAAACIRFRSDAPPDGGSGIEDAGTPIEGGDAVIILPPVCEGLPPTTPGIIAGNLITGLVNDCRLSRHFSQLPPTAITHLQECLTAQIGQVMGCLQADGEPFRYPIEYERGKFCRDMKGSHKNMSASDGDFNAFIEVLDGALATVEELTPDDRMRVLKVFGATRSDIVHIEDAGPTKPCDAPDAG
jgi:hypothetical protein